MTDAQSIANPKPVQEIRDSAALARALQNPPIRGLYAHVPFCVHKCHYCDFYSIVEPAEAAERFVDRWCAETRVIGPLVTGSLETIFVGGGTPTLLSAAGWRRWGAALAEAFDGRSLLEFTVEANPETVHPELIEALLAVGVNRVSLGVQSFDDRALRVLERRHDPASVPRAVEALRRAGLSNLNLDLIFSVPGTDPDRTMRQWLADLDAALALEPDHLSCYALSYEPNTPLTRKLQQGRVQRCDPDLEADLFEATLDRLTAAGFEHYEVSNFARPGRQCRHNLLYWRNASWWALGPSAAGHAAGVRWKNVPHLGRYLASSGASPIQDVEMLDADAALGERLMLGLRLREGVRRDEVEPLLDERRAAAIGQALDRGHMERDATHLRLTRAGLMLGDAVIAELL